MNDPRQSSERLQSSRRTVLKAGGVASVASVLGLSGTALAQQDGGDAGQDGEDDGGRTGWMFAADVRPGSVFRVESPALDVLPDIQADAQAVLENATLRVVEYFNTDEEALLFVPADVEVEQGTIYQFAEGARPVEGGGEEGLVEVRFRRVENQNLPFDLEDSDIGVLAELGGEGAVRPRNFSAGALFRITSEPLGWVPQDVADSGFFTDYDTRHARYLGTDEEFLFFPQESAEVEVGALYVMQDEFELFSPAGNVVAAEFEKVDEGTVDIDESFL